ncbi:TIGR02186 family protein [Terrarubrum flagellatum]|uniref:TIGR02186 family protein n=1 Tax=Terrirubrum flagellatum TaxID=2895980 RepID=UPI0031450281
MRRLLALLILLCAPGAASAEGLLVSLSSHRVQITSNYTGAQLAAFAVIERDARTVARANPYDAVITVRGPSQDVIVQEKRQAFGLWIDQRQRFMGGVPGYLSVLASRPLQDVIEPDRAARLNLGLLPIVTSTQKNVTDSPREQEFRASLVRLRFESGLYSEKERGVTFLTPNVFQAQIVLPATAPLGNYEVEIALFGDSVLLARQQTNFEVVKVGFEQLIADAARQRPLGYGLVAAALSIFFGWLSSVAFRKD